MHLYLINKLSQQPKRKRKVHNVRDQRAAITRLKAVLMVPQLIRSAQLQIDKPVWRLPLHNFTGPAQWNSMHPQLVMNECSLADWLRINGENLKTQPWRRYGFQVFCP